ncbi:MAG: amidohydrolase [Bacteroidota bacterium]
MFKLFKAILLCFSILGFTSCKKSQQTFADLIITNAKIITVDSSFSIASDLAIKGDRFIGVGTQEEISGFKGNETRIIDLQGKTVVPGLIDAHMHPETASISELDEEIPVLNSIEDLLQWIRAQATTKAAGEWIIHPKLFYTRLGDLRQPTIEELDEAAPKNPVFLNGSYGGLINTQALKVSRITLDPKNEGLIKDPETNEFTGFIKGTAFRLLKLPPEKEISKPEKTKAIKTLFSEYNRYGITGIISGYIYPDFYEIYKELNQSKGLSLRIYQNYLFPFDGVESKEALIDSINSLPTKTGEGDEWLRTGSMKIILDGGILTGTAYLREPWGEQAAKVYNITDPKYTGFVKYTPERLYDIVTAIDQAGWIFTAHSTGGGGVDLLLDTFEKLNSTRPVNDKRFSIIHGNFYTKESIQRMHDLGIMGNIQPAWFYEDADAMKYILGEQRIKTFNPYGSMQRKGVILNGGSDHMVKLDANTSINPYNPFLGMWVMVTRTTKDGTIIEPDEALTREAALKAYTINNAYATFEESIKGSIEVGKLADLAVLSKDPLTCSENEIKTIESELTIVGGKVVYKVE